MVSRIEALQATDFDAYLPERASSNAFVRPRIATKDKLTTTGKLLAERARTQNAGISLEVHASDERPSIWNRKSVTCQWVFLSRDKNAREELERAHPDKPLEAELADPTPYYRHAFLALLLDSKQLEVTLRLHKDAWADVKHLRGRLALPAGREAVSAALKALPEDFVLGAEGAEDRVAKQCDATVLEALLTEVEQRGVWLRVGIAWKREEVLAVGEGIGEGILAAFDALLPLYRLLAWRPDDDLASITQEIERERIAREAHVAELAARVAEWEAKHHEELEKRREVASAEARERVAAQAPARRPEYRKTEPVAERSERVEKPEREERKSAPKEQPVKREGKRPEKPAKESVHPTPAVRSVAAGVVLGARVKVRSGPFAGRVGTVAELDAKGHAKVLLGLLSARIETTELVPVEG